MFQGAINYEVTGIYPGDNFFDVDRLSGSLRAIKDLRTDTIARPEYVVSIKIYFT